VLVGQVARRDKRQLKARHDVEGADDQVDALSITCAGGGVSDPHP
jgi:hypothetical protein